MVDTKDAVINQLSLDNRSIPISSQFPLIGTTKPRHPLLRSYSSKHGDRVLRAGWLRLGDVPVLHNASSVHTKNIDYRLERLSRSFHLLMEPAHTVAESLVSEGELEVAPDRCQSVNRVLATTCCVRVVVDIVHIDMLVECTGYVLLDPEFLVKLIENLFLLEFCRGFRGAIWISPCIYSRERAG